MFSFVLFIAVFTTIQAQLSITTCGSTTCQVGGSTGCKTYTNIPSNGACQNLDGIGLTATLANSPPFGFRVNLFSTTDCSGTPISTAANLQANGVSGCQTFATGGVYATIASGYIEMKQITGTTCSGSVLATNIVGPQNCVPTPGSSSGNSYQINCGNVAETFSTSAAASVSYFTSSDCTGIATSTGNAPPNALPSGCSPNNAVVSISSRCVSGATYSTPSGPTILSQTLYANAACPAAGLPTQTVVYARDQCLSFNSTSSITASCSGGGVKLSTFTPSTTCSGGFQASTTNLGCSVSNGVSSVLAGCTSGAKAANLAVLSGVLMTLALLFSALA